MLYIMPAAQGVGGNEQDRIQEAREIVNGHRDRTLQLLWKIIFVFKLRYVCYIDLKAFNDWNSLRMIIFFAFETPPSLSLLSILNLLLSFTLEIFISFFLFSFYELQLVVPERVIEESCSISASGNSKRYVLNIWYELSPLNLFLLVFTLLLYLPCQGDGVQMNRQIGLKSAKIIIIIHQLLKYSTICH